MAGSAQRELRGRRAQKAAGPRVEYGLPCVGLAVGTGRAATLPGSETRGDSMGHPLKVGRERVKVSIQRGVDSLVQRPKSVVDAVSKP